MGIIGISGKLNSGKDTVGEIVQIISASPHFTDEAVLSFIGRQHLNSIWEIKKFADKLKDIVCMLLGCTREQLEDRKFKEKELGEEWWYYKDSLFTERMLPYTDNKELEDDLTYCIIKLTPRLLLQLLGTECGRQIIHPNIWCNSLMSEYVSQFNWSDSGREGLPNWIITDMRFPNELKAVENRQGITIRVNRFMCSKCGNTDNFEGGNDLCNECGHFRSNDKEHESETALDNAKFNYTINNDGTLLELIAKVRQILIEQKILKNE